MTETLTPETDAEAVIRLSEERDHWKQLAEEGLEPRMRSMRYEGGQFDMEITGQAAEAISLAMVGHFKALGAANYIEMNLFDRDSPFERYTVTVQKVGAKSPADKVRDAEARVRELEELVEALQGLAAS